MGKTSGVLLALGWLVGCGGASPSSSAFVTSAERSAEQPTEKPAPVIPTGRLPDTVAPVRYALEMTVVPTEDTFRGTVTVDVAITEPTGIIWMHARDLTLEKAVIERDGRGLAANIIPGNDHVFGIAPSQPLAPGKARIHITYTGRFDDDRTQGLYRETEGEQAYAYTKFEPIDARRAFPCFDEPEHKVPWQLTFHVKEDHVALGNAPVVSETAGEDGMKTVVLAESKPMPSYLVAFVVGPFDIVDAGTVGKNDAPLRFIVPQGRKDETRYAAEVTPRIVSMLEDYFGMAYPYPKLDVAVVPRYWGTMEHPGIVALGQPLTLIPPDRETADRKRAYVNIAIHELAHYWFGDYVTMAWWNDIWLNESFATWLDVKITSAFEPTWKYGLTRYRWRERAMSTDRLASAKTLQEPVATNHEIESSFDNGITYFKGASLLFMFEHWLGEKKFRDAIRRYMTRFAWKNVTTADFYAVMDEALGQNLSQSLATFVTQPGHPVVSVKLHCDAGASPKLELSQSRYVPLGVEDTASLTWQFPVCVRHGANGKSHEQCTLLADKTAMITLEGDACPSWVWVNDGGYGYYRTAYSPELLDALTDVAPKKLSTIERLSLTGDLDALLESGDVSVAGVVEYAISLADDKDPDLVARAARMLGRRSLVPDELLPAHAVLVRKTFGKRARRLGWKKRRRDSVETHDLRRTLLSVVGGAGRDPRIRARARKLANAYLKDRTAVADDMVGLVLSLAAKDGDAALFDRYLAAARQTKSRRERGRLLSALGAFEERAVVDRALALTLSDDFDLRETFSIFWRVLGQRQHRDHAYAFLKENFDAIANRMTQTAIIGQLFRIPAVFCDAEHLADAKEFFIPRAKRYEGAPPSLEKTFETMRICIAIKAHHQPVLIELLKSS